MVDKARTAAWAINVIRKWVHEALEQSKKADGTYDSKRIQRYTLDFSTREEFEGFLRLLNVSNGKCLAQHIALIMLAHDANIPPSLRAQYTQFGKDKHSLSLRL